MGLFEKIQARTSHGFALLSVTAVILLTHLLGLELYRLEQRYTKRAKRTTFISDAVYVDGEYIYGARSPTSPKSETSTSSKRLSRLPSSITRGR
jgi:hypothetical protein